MKSRLKLRSFIAALGSAAMLSAGLVVASPAHAGMCTTDATTGVETCVNTLKDGAQYKFMVPTKITTELCFSGAMASALHLITQDIQHQQVYSK